MQALHFHKKYLQRVSFQRWKAYSAAVCRSRTIQLQSASVGALHSLLSCWARWKSALQARYLLDERGEGREGGLTMFIRRITEREKLSQAVFFWRGKYDLFTSSLLIFHLAMLTSCIIMTKP